MQKKVIFYIHGKTAEKTAYLMSKVLKKYKFIKVAVENGECVFTTDQVDGSFNSWLIEMLLESKTFLGKYHENHPLHYLTKRIQKLQERYESVVCRFGWWDSMEYPNDLEVFEYHRQRMIFMLKGMPKYLANYHAANIVGNVHEPHDDCKGFTRESYISDLVENYGDSEEQATKKVDKYFAHYNIAPSLPKPIDPVVEEENKIKMMEHFRKLVDVLSYYTSAKARKDYLNRSGTIVDFLYLGSLIQRHGRTWFIENIGEIEGLT